MSTDAQIRANQANSLHSTGPKTEAGKARSATNALKSGLTGRTVLLPGDDVAAYRALLDQFTARYQPATPEEKLLTQKIVDSEWRLARVPELMDGVYLIGYRELGAQVADECKDDDEATRAVVLRTRVWLHYRKELNNLTLQESRLRRQLEKDTAELKTLQRPRLRQLEQDASQAGEAHRQDPKTYTLQYFRDNGFEFSDELWHRTLFSRIERAKYGHNPLLLKIDYKNKQGEFAA